jgi:hypothetical protein
MADSERLEIESRAFMNLVLSCEPAGCDNMQRQPGEGWAGGCVRCSVSSPEEVNQNFNNGGCGNAVKSEVSGFVSSDGVFTPDE